MKVPLECHLSEIMLFTGNASRSIPTIAPFAKSTCVRQDAVHISASIEPDAAATRKTAWNLLMFHNMKRCFPSVAESDDRVEIVLQQGTNVVEFFTSQGSGKPKMTLSFRLFLIKI